MTSERSLGPVLEFMRHLWALEHNLQAAGKRMGHELGITGLQRLALRIIGRYPGISAGELANVLHIHPSTLTGVLKRLQMRGLVVRGADPRDSRRAVLQLTDEGRRLDVRRTGLVELATRRGLGRLSPEQIAAAQQVLTVLAENIGRPESR